MVSYALLVENIHLCRNHNDLAWQ